MGAVAARSDFELPFNLPMSGARKPSGPARVLCYGDSLTAGFYAGGRKFNPYGAALREALGAEGLDCDVQMCGLSGHRASQMVAEVDAPVTSADITGRRHRGLGYILDQEGPFDLVILMAGTNDFTPGTTLKSILEPVYRLHAACHQRGVPTVLMAPPSGWQEFRRPVVAKLREWSDMMPEVLAFVDPEELIQRKQKVFWDPDNIHFSPAGSNALGQSLASLVSEALEDAPKQKRRLSKLLKRAKLSPSTSPQNTPRPPRKAARGGA